MRGIPMTDDEISVIHRLYATHSDTIIGQIIGRCDRTVYLYRKRAGLLRQEYPKISGRNKDRTRGTHDPDSVAVEETMMGEWLRKRSWLC